MSSFIFNCFCFPTTEHVLGKWKIKMKLKRYSIPVMFNKFSSDKHCCPYFYVCDIVRACVREWERDREIDSVCDSMCVCV